MKMLLPSLPIIALSLTMACAGSPKDQNTATQEEAASHAEPLHSEDSAQEAAPESPEPSPMSAYLMSQRTSYEDCYYKEQALKPALSGLIRLSLDIDAQGSVQSVEVLEDTVRDENVQSCLLTTVATWVFPPEVHEKKLRLPFSFAPHAASDAEVREMMYKHKSQLDACHEAAQKPTGNLVLAWSVDASGVVLNERVLESSFQNADFERCVLGVIKQMQFNPSQNRVEVQYPLAF